MSTQSQFWDEIDFSYSTIAWIGLANGLGIILGYLAAGLLADRRSKRILTCWCALGLTAMSAVVALLAFGDLLRGDWCFFVAALFGMIHGVATAVVLGWIGELLPRKLIAKGVVVLSFSSIAHGILLSFPAVLLMDQQHATLALFTIASLLYLSAALSTRRVPTASVPSLQIDSALEGLKSAAAYMWRDTRIQTLWIYFLFAGILSIILHFALTDLLLTESDTGQLTFSLGLIARGLAAVVATICLVYAISGRNRWRVYLAASAIAGVTVVITSFVSSYLLLILLFIPQSAAMSAAVLASEALAMSATRREYFGRVAALLLFAGNILFFASGFIGGFLRDWFDGRWLALAIGVILSLAAVWLYRRWRGFRHLPDDPDEPQVKYGNLSPIAAHLTGHLAPQKLGTPDTSSFPTSGNRDGQLSGSSPE
ncbi:MAG: MFS transporter [Chloroflexi bacterium]|nr:MFS transporter [Chloroflexota bacterium]